MLIMLIIILFIVISLILITRISQRYWDRRFLFEEFGTIDPEEMALIKQLRIIAMERDAWFRDHLPPVQSPDPSHVPQQMYAEEYERRSQEVRSMPFVWQKQAYKRLHEQGYNLRELLKEYRQAEP